MDRSYQEYFDMILGECRKNYRQAVYTYWKLSQSWKKIANK